MLRIEKIIINIPPKMHGCGCDECKDTLHIKHAPAAEQIPQPSFSDLFKAFLMSLAGSQYEVKKTTPDEPKKETDTPFFKWDVGEKDPDAPSVFEKKEDDDE